MDETFDIFEIEKGDFIWRDSADGQQEAARKLTELSQSSENEFSVLHVPTQKVIATANVPPQGASKPWSDG